MSRLSAADRERGELARARFRDSEGAILRLVDHETEVRRLRRQAALLEGALYVVTFAAVMIIAALM
jgi:hypothetical protein